MKTPKQILERIATGADCEDHKECLSCPLAKLKRSEDNSRWLSCFESVVGNSDDISTGYIELRYKDAARHTLATRVLEELIGGEDVQKD